MIKAEYRSWIDDLDLIFKVTARLNASNVSQKVFVCMLYPGPLDGMLPKFASLYKSDRINSLLDFDDLDLIFKVTASWLKLPP